MDTVLNNKFEVEQGLSRVNALCEHFTEVQNQRMRGVAWLNTALHVQSVGIVVASDPVQTILTHAQGILLTPWFMSLLRLPLEAQTEAVSIGAKVVRDFGQGSIEFMLNHAPVVGYFETASLFSSMSEFVSQEHAVAVAQTVLENLRAKPSPSKPSSNKPPQPSQPTRRAFFLPRATTQSAP